MADRCEPPQLTDQQRARMLGVLDAGGDREMAARLVGITGDDLLEIIERDPAWNEEVRRAEGWAEFKHMSNIARASEDPKNWRASVWWLERHSPERFAARAPAAITPRQLTHFTAMLAVALSDEIHDDHDRQRVRAKLEEIVRYAFE